MLAAAAGFLLALGGVASVGRAQQPGLLTAPVPALDSRDQRAVADAYARVLLPAAATPSGYVGSVLGGMAGSVSEDYQRATLSAINFARALAGVPGDVTLDPALSAKCQQAALTFAAADSLSHYLDARWPFYTAEGADAARNSNIGTGNAGPGAVLDYLDDGGVGNVGHRRWILFPPQATMGSGSVDDPDPTLPDHDIDNGGRANALWVQAPRVARPAPAARDGFIAWPPPGWVPAPLLPSTYGYWSVSLPPAPGDSVSFPIFVPDFSAAQVSVAKDGVDLGPIALQPQSPTVEEERRGTHAGWSTLVFSLPAANAVSNAAVETYRVRVTGLRDVRGPLADVSYEVRSFPAVPAVHPEVSVTADPAKRAFTFTRNVADLSRPLAVTFYTYGPDGGLGNGYFLKAPDGGFIGATPGGAGYALLPVAVIPAGSASVRLKVRRVAWYAAGHAIHAEIQEDPLNYSMGANATTAGFTLPAGVQ